MATTGSRGQEEPRLAQPDASPSLDIDGLAKATPAPVFGAIARASSAVLCQTATERLSGHEEPEGQASQAVAAQVPGIAAPVRAKPRQGLGRYPDIMARANPANVALLGVQRHHRGLPH